VRHNEIAYIKPLKKNPRHNKIENWPANACAHLSYPTGETSWWWEGGVWVGWNWISSTLKTDG